MCSPTSSPSPLVVPGFARWVQALAGRGLAHGIDELKHRLQPVMELPGTIPLFELGNHAVYMNGKARILQPQFLAFQLNAPVKADALSSVGRAG